MANDFNDLFSGNLDSTMDFLNDRKPASKDGIYRIDLTKVSDKKRGYKSRVRFLPNLTKDGKLGPAAIEKITHYVDIKSDKALSGWFDSPKNFNEKCPLTDLYYQLKNSKNAVLMEKAECLKYSKKYYSYVLILEDEQQPELVGKIMIFQYGKQIRDKIQSEKNGEITGESCNVFRLEDGKDFVLSVKEKSIDGEAKVPDYTNSMFMPERTSLSIYSEDRGTFKNVPLVEGRIDQRVQKTVMDFLLKRDHELEDFAAKKLTDEEHDKINQIIGFLTGKASASYPQKSSKPSSDDFDFEESFTAAPAAAPSKPGGFDEDDDFFKDL